MRRYEPWTSRRLPRRAASIACQAVRLRDFTLIADRIVNVSPTGVLLSPADPVLTGEPMVLSFRLPHWGRWVDAEANVARVVHGRRPGDGSRAVGLVFEHLTDQARFLLEQAMRWMPPVPPGLRAGRRSTGQGFRRLVARSTAVTKAG